MSVSGGAQSRGGTVPLGVEAGVQKAMCGPESGSGGAAAGPDAELTEHRAVPLGEETCHPGGQAGCCSAGQQTGVPQGHLTGITFVFTCTSYFLCPLITLTVSASAVALLQGPL